MTTDINTTRILCLDFQCFWIAGAGRGKGHYLDQECIKDINDLPFVPGKHLRGLLLNAIRRAEIWGRHTRLIDSDMRIILNSQKGMATSITELLFGSTSEVQDRHTTFPGILSIRNAVLADQEYNFLNRVEQASLRQYLYQPLFSTKIDHSTGTAENMSLRSIEVALPIKLYSRLDLKITAQDEGLLEQQQWFMHKDHLDKVWEIIELALPLIDAIGSHRNRGLGEVELTMQNFKENDNEGA